MGGPQILPPASLLEPPRSSPLVLDYSLHSTSSSGEWSAQQPEHTPHSDESSGPSRGYAAEESPYGIAVPVFLQPLLGLEFVPYLPSPEGDTPPNHHHSQQQQHSRHHDSNHDIFVLRHTDVEDFDDTEAELEEIDQSNQERCLHEVAQQLVYEETAVTSRQEVRGRKKLFPRNRENRGIKKAFGKTLNVIKNGRLLKKDTASTEDDDLERTPRRRGPRSASKETIRSLPDTMGTSLSFSSSSERLWHWNQIDRQVQNLKSLEDKAHTVSQRAAVVQGRISRLTHEAYALQQALARVFQTIDQEKAQLESTEEELQRLHDGFQQAARQLSVSLEKVQRGITVPQSKIIRVVSPPTTTDKLSTLMDGRQSHHTTVHGSPIDVVGLDACQRSYTETDRRRAKYGRPKRGESLEILPDYATPIPRRRANTDPDQSSGMTSATSFMRVGDLELQSSSSLSGSFHSLDDALQSRLMNATLNGSDDFFLLEENVPHILSRLAELGLQMSTDESRRFTPVSDTPRILQNKKCLTQQPLPGWPFSPWHVAKDKDILVWTGSVHHKGFGHDWPVVKARCLVRTSPRQLLDFLMDASQLKKYNKMSQGRETVFVLQEGVDTRVEDSPHGFPGDARILRALNKPKLLPKTIEMLSLWYSRAIPDAPDSYMTVSRSVWENATGTPKNSNRLRSEMLLGVNLMRACPEGCELTTITHVFAPGVPEMMAKRMAPQSAANMMREIQSIFA